MIGEGYGIVIRTGDQTVLGQIAGMTDGEEKRPSPMSVEIDNLVKFTAFIAVVFAIVFFIVGFKVYPNIASNVNFAIGMLVAFVPQGLPATVSVSKLKKRFIGTSYCKMLKIAASDIALFVLRCS